MKVDLLSAESGGYDQGDEGVAASSSSAEMVDPSSVDDLELMCAEDVELPRSAEDLEPPNSADGLLGCAEDLELTSVVEHLDVL
mmetsp:Transcript_47278/g.83175  ORF Transcript_47278/g.83175 Transcript_47278/m.83175 type:complete len:84 (-) Transcript_47278:37-288(-)